MLAYRVELYRRRTNEWVPTGPASFDREMAVRLLRSTLAPDALKRLTVQWIGRATEELGDVPPDFDGPRLEFYRHLVASGRLNEGYASPQTEHHQAVTEPIPRQGAMNGPTNVTRAAS